MGLYPIEVANQELYTSSTTKKHRIGTRAIFDTVNGPVEAVYVRNANAGTLAAGLVVHHSATPWVCNTTLYAATNDTIGTVGMVGVLCASLPGSATEAYAWAAVRGPITAMNVAATVASSDHNGVLYRINLGTANLATVVSTLATGGEIPRVNIVGLGGGATTTIATSGGAGPAFVNVFWR
jgi:hypothetical protein